MQSTYNQSPQVHVTNTISVQPVAPTIVVVNNGQNGPGAIVRIIWFLCVGLWLGLLATVVGWFLCVAVITLPIGLLLLNRLPALMTLRPATSNVHVSVDGHVTTIRTGIGAEQTSFLIRAIYFLLVGWWFSGLWLAAAWCLVALSVPTLGLSLAPAFLMFDRVPKVLTLRAN
jgi:uncharacterized membrane protein YccF (DUF307 family)